MSDTLKQKAKRVLKKFDFSKEDHNISLVGESVGHAANGRKTLILKSSNQPETIEVKKALEQVTVKMSMEEFLIKFFDMWSSDAELLTKLMGFETEYEAWKRENEDSDKDSWDYSTYLEGRIAQFEIMKSLNAGELTEINKSAFEEIVALQQKIETPLADHFETKGKQMEELEIAKSAITSLEAEKASQVEVIKSLESKVAELTEQVNVLKAAEEKAKFDAFAEQLKGLVADEQFETVAKGLYQLHQIAPEAAAQTIETMKSAVASKTVADKVESEQLTVEQGHAEVVDAEQAKIAKAKEIMNKSILGKK